MKQMHFILILLVSMIVGCSQPADQKTDSAKDDVSLDVGKLTETAREKAQPGFDPFYVYKDIGSRDNHYIPSGFMPNGECLTFNDKWTENCQSGSTCMKIEYDVECSRLSQKWAGIYWLNPPNNWGSKKGGFNLTGASKLTFWAKGEVGGEVIQEVTIGGISGNYPDTDTAVIGPVILSNEWRQYTIDLRGKDLSYISGGFSWSTSEDVNPDAACTFYIDEVKYE